MSTSTARSVPMSKSATVIWVPGGGPLLSLASVVPIGAVRFMLWCPTLSWSAKWPWSSVSTLGVPETSSVAPGTGAPLWRTVPIHVTIGGGGGVWDGGGAAGNTIGSGFGQGAATACSVTWARFGSTGVVVTSSGPGKARTVPLCWKECQ